MIGERGAPHLPIAFGVSATGIERRAVLIHFVKIIIHFPFEELLRE